MAYITTPINGSETCPANVNEFYTMVDTIASQEIANVKSGNRIEDGLFHYDLTEANGMVIEQAIIAAAEKQVWDKSKCDMSPLDPNIVVRYFNNFTSAQYKATIRKDDIRRIIANKGVGVDDVVEKILDTLTQGLSRDEFTSSRDLILKTAVTDYSNSLGGIPKNMRGVIYAIRDMYNTLRSDNSNFTEGGFSSYTPDADIRIALTDKLLNLIGVVELANILNLSEVELMGKLVIIPASGLTENIYKIVVYDRKAFNSARRLRILTYDTCASGIYTNYYLTVEDAYFYSPLFKATSLDVTTAATTALDEIIAFGFSADFDKTIK